MDSGATTGIPQSSRAMLYGWAGFALVALVATMLFRSLALMVLSLVAGGALIVTGVRAAGWPRPVLIVVGTLLVLAPIVLIIDVMTASVAVTVR